MKHSKFFIFNSKNAGFAAPIIIAMMVAAIGIIMISTLQSRNADRSKAIRLEQKLADAHASAMSAAALVSSLFQTKKTIPDAINCPIKTTNPVNYVMGFNGFNMVYRSCQGNDPTDINSSLLADGLPYVDARASLPTLYFKNYFASDPTDIGFLRTAHNDLREYLSPENMRAIVSLPGFNQDQFDAMKDDILAKANALPTAIQSISDREIVVLVPKSGADQRSNLDSIFQNRGSSTQGTPARVRIASVERVGNAIYNVTYSVDVDGARSPIRIMMPLTEDVPMAKAVGIRVKSPIDGQWGLTDVTNLPPNQTVDLQFVVRGVVESAQYNSMMSSPLVTLGSGCKAIQRAADSDQLCEQGNDRRGWAANNLNADRVCAWQCRISTGSDPEMASRTSPSPVARREISFKARVPNKVGSNGLTEISRTIDVIKKPSCSISFVDLSGGKRFQDNNNRFNTTQVPHDSQVLVVMFAYGFVYSNLNPNGGAPVGANWKLNWVKDVGGTLVTQESMNVYPEASSEIFSVENVFKCNEPGYPTCQSVWPQNAVVPDIIKNAHSNVVEGQPLMFYKWFQLKNETTEDKLFQIEGFVHGPGGETVSCYEGVTLPGDNTYQLLGVRVEPKPPASSQCTASITGPKEIMSDNNSANLEATVSPDAVSCTINGRSVSGSLSGSHNLSAYAPSWTAGKQSFLMSCQNATGQTCASNQITVTKNCYCAGGPARVSDILTNQAEANDCVAKIRRQGGNCYACGSVGVCKCEAVGPKTIGYWVGRADDVRRENPSPCGCYAPAIRANTSWWIGTPTYNGCRQ